VARASTHFFGCLLFTLGTAAMAVQSAGHARVELIARQGAVSPGSDLQLGVHFVLEPGWHIYWINPGDSGQPPTFKWQLPQGFSAGDVQWPRPERMQPTPELADFGYHGEVLLPFTVRVSAATAAGPPVQIGAEAKWLICREVCIPEHAHLDLSLPVAATAKENPQSAPLFQQAEKLLPRPLPRGWKVSAKSAQDGFVLTVEAGRKITQAQFFPLEPAQIDNPALQKLQPSPRGVKIALKKSELLLKPVAVLRGVLVLPGGAYRIEAPVRQSIQ
jgi:DsbC/DsbD-like thiol-disulfide interchange protein